MRAPEEPMDVDLDGLLCALVLAPRTFARNRFYPLFTQPEPRRIRRRAAQLRTMVRHLAAREGAAGNLLELAPSDHGCVVRYRVAPLKLERTMILDPLEIALARFALDRAALPGVLPVMTLTEEDRARVEGALAKLGKRLDPSGHDPAAEARSPGSFSPGEI
jgi:hypothetical protein